MCLKNFCYLLLKYFFQNNNLKIHKNHLKCNIKLLNKYFSITLKEWKRDIIIKHYQYSTFVLFSLVFHSIIKIFCKLDVIKIIHYKMKILDEKKAFQVFRRINFLPVMFKAKLLSLTHKSEDAVFIQMNAYLEIKFQLSTWNTSNNRTLVLFSFSAWMQMVW